MDIYWIVYNISLFIIGLTIIIWSLKLYNFYKLKFLFYFSVFITTRYIFEFINILGRSFARRLMVGATTSSNVITLLHLILYLVAIPFFILSVYYFIKFIMDLIGKNFLSIYKILFISFYGIYLLYYLYFIYGYSRLKSEEFLNFNLSLFVIVSVMTSLILFITCLMVLFINRKVIQNQRLQARIKIFGLIYLFLHILEFVIIDILEYNYYTYTITEFFIHLPPLLYLRGLLVNHFQKGVIKPSNLKIDEFLSRHQISAREKEIVLLMLEGKSNREIEDELYISLRTVKTHIYNIYKKLGISSRWHLFSILK